METLKITDDGKKKTTELVKELRKKFNVYLYEESLDDAFPPPESPTTRFFRDTQAPDEETLGKSYREIESLGFISECMTLRERLIFEKVYFEKHGKHPDTRGWTITGSRGSDGRVPCVYWDPDSCWVCVYCYALDDAHSSGGVRRAVSLDAQNSFPLSENFAVVNGKKYNLVEVKA